jgi:hypothetical protein
METAKLAADDLPAPIVNWVNRNTLFGSPAFARLWVHQGGRPVFWAVSESDRIIAVLPGVEFGGGKLTRFQAMPDGLYAPLLFPSGRPTEEGAAEAVMAALVKAGYLKTIVNDFHARLEPPAEFRSGQGETNLVDISGPDWQPPDTKLRSEIRKAERELVSCHEFSLNRHFDSFLGLMRRTEIRHGRQPKYQPDFYRDLAKLAMTDERVKWVVCQHDEALAASHIYLVEGDQLFYWQAFFDKEYAFLKANQFLTYSVAREMAARGTTVLNTGATPPEAEGLSDYKRKWGGRSFTYPILERRSWIGGLLP